jgi:hypothetical protein
MSVFGGMVRAGCYRRAWRFLRDTDPAILIPPDAAIACVQPRVPQSAIAVVVVVDIGKALAAAALVLGHVER